MKSFELDTVVNSRTGIKYYSCPDLISYLHEMKSGQSKEVRDFVEEIIVALATGKVIGGGYRPIA